MSVLTFRKPAWRRLSSPDLGLTEFLELQRCLYSGRWDSGRSARLVERRIGRILGVDPAGVFALPSQAVARDLAACAVLSSAVRPSMCPLINRQGVWGDHRSVDCDPDGWPAESVDIGSELWGRPWPQAQVPMIMDCPDRAPSPDHRLLLERGVCAIVYDFGPSREVSSLNGAALVLRDQEAIGRIRDHLTRADGPIAPVSDPVAAVIAMKLRRIDRVRERRQTVLAQYQNELGGLLVTPPTASGAVAVIRYKTTQEREHVRAHLRKHAVETAVPYPVEERLGCPQATDLSRRVLSIPCHAGLSDRDVKRVCRLIVSA